MNYRKAVYGNRNGIKSVVCKRDGGCTAVGDIRAKGASMTRSYRSVPAGVSPERTRCGRSSSLRYGASSRHRRSGSLAGSV